MSDRSSTSNKFEFVVIAGARAKQLLKGCTPRTTGPDKVIKLALKEKGLPIHRGVSGFADVRLLAGAANVSFGDPAVPEFETQPAHHGTIWQNLVAILPVLDTEDFVEPVLN